MDLTQAEIDVLNERASQRTKYDALHDDEHVGGDIARAAAGYALNAGRPISAGARPLFWPFEDDAWKPRTAREDLVRAAAMCIAEIERIDRIK